MRSAYDTTVPVRSRRLSTSLSAVSGHGAAACCSATCTSAMAGMRHLQRHAVVEHLVAPQIGVRQHVVADALRVPQAAAMADHQPAMRPQHREMIGDRLRVRRTDADIHQRHAVIAGRVR